MYNNEQKSDNKLDYCKNIDLILRNKPISYQELEMSSHYINAHEDISQHFETIQLHSHNFYELIFCRSGNIQYLLGTNRYRIQPGDVIIVPPGISHRPIISEHLDESYERYIVWLSQEFVNELKHIDYTSTILDQKLTTYLLHTSGAERDQTEHLFNNLAKEFLNQSTLWNVKMFAHGAELAVHLIRLLSTSRQLPNPEKKSLLDDAMTYIEQNLSQQLSLESAAKFLHVSESTISKNFRDRMNVSFYHFVTQRRLIASKALIISGESLQNIPDQIGFRDYSSFFRAFKKEYGISPTDYKKINQSIISES